MEVDMTVAEAPALPSAPSPLQSTPPASAGSPGTTKAGEPRRRNRPALSCIQCRTRKIRCDRNEPCASCMKSKIVNCTYEEARRPKPRLWRLSPAPGGSASYPERSSPSSTDERASVGSAFTFRDIALPAPPPTSNPSGRGSSAAPPGKTAEPLSAVSPRSALPSHKSDSTHGTIGPFANTAALSDRVRQLEQQLADALRRPDYSSPSSRSAHGTLSPDHAPLPRPCGPSSMTNGDKLFPLLVSVAERVETDRTCDAYFALQKCRDMGRAISSTRTSTSTPLQFGTAIPPEETSSRLFDAYSRTFETVYRILHRPTFGQAYQKYWENPAAADSTFVVLFQLCMAIGTCFQDDAAALRRSAAQWIHEAHVWLVSAENSLVSVAGMQVMCLLHLARETCGIGGHLCWIGAGSLLRTAMQLGLHRDPDDQPGMSVFDAEVRRRLWASILEIVLQSSLDSGAPPLLALSDFDTRPPSNYDDEQLAENAQFPSIPRPPNAFTQTTVQIALLRSFPVRLAIAHYVNHFRSSATFEETLKWNTELTNACRALSATFQPFYDPAGILPKRLSLFQLRLAEHMVHRFFLALNYPWLWSAHKNPTYYFARKMCVETSLKLYRAIATGSPAGDSGTASQSDDFTRLATCGYGAFRSVPTLAVSTIGLELLWQVQEDRSFRQSMSIDHHHHHHHHHHHPMMMMDHRSSSSAAAGAASGSEPDVNNSSVVVGMGIGSGAAPRQELLEAVKYSIGWTERRIRCGETNVKGYLLFSALLCQAQALQRGVSDAEVERAVLGTVGEDLERCLFWLKDAAAGGRNPSFAAAAAVGGGAVNGGGGGAAALDERADSAGRGSGPPDARETSRTRGFSSIFNIHDADFFIGT
ncbi:hypothetical protein N658DRAFT_432628 [Parathielavia hyrcaniae]|uniref:Zn(2)-C6 fungal-type domain-containing protein n=1 Tax=Parathielavia hyrcaniae TaxID=113614 RepID=A0AAN6SZ49_9PEZI|nr:hypothetical protein N658DRAFT_432628 [Parathielavia hyrcaniae]